MTDIRWKQRFDNFCKAFSELKEGLELANDRALSKLEQQGVIQGFEYTHELAWNLLKDYLEFQGHVGLTGSRDTTREAFKRGLIENAAFIYAEIVTRYFPQFQALHTEFLKRTAEENE
jgi:nucleotidyltransferase substrate binding protein (TIGR01987 family)